MSFQEDVRNITNDMESDSQLILKSPADALTYHILLKNYVKLLRMALSGADKELISAKNATFPDHRTYIERAKEEFRKQKQAEGGVVLESRNKSNFENNCEPTKTFCIGGPFDQTFVDRPADMKFGQMIPVFNDIYTFGEDSNLHHNEEETRKFQASRGGE